MEFNQHKPIYLQICDRINELILSDALKAEERIQSVRELGIELGVNPNTVVRSYEYLQNKGIIFNKRGIGYFISKDAKELVLKEQKKEFIENEIPMLFKKMKLYNMDIDEIVKIYRKE